MLSMQLVLIFVFAFGEIIAGSIVGFFKTWFWSCFGKFGNILLFEYVQGTSTSTTPSSNNATIDQDEVEKEHADCSSTTPSSISTTPSSNKTVDDEEIEETQGSSRDFVVDGMKMVLFNG